MDVRTSDKTRYRITLICILLGFSFYLALRPQVLGLNWHIDPSLISWLPSWFISSFPSFIFLPLITAATLSFMPKREAEAKSRLIGTLALWFIIIAVSEGLQSASIGLLSRGSFDWLDLVAILVSAPMTLILLWPAGIKQEVQEETESESLAEHKHWPAFRMLPIFLLGMASIFGSTIDTCDGENIDALCISPVILSWQDVRQDIQVDLAGDQRLKRTGKIHSLDNWLFVVEKYRGIHIFDVTDQLNPIRKLYLPIPGALDLTIKDGILYSSAFSDLISLDLDKLLQTDGLELAVSRQEDVFEYPASHQFYPRYPQYYYTSYSEPDPSLEGVVIGYKTQSGKIVLYGDDYDLTLEKALKKEAKEDEEEDTLKPVCFLLFNWMC